jgi:hypothetical protein
MKDCAPPAYASIARWECTVILVLGIAECKNVKGRNGRTKYVYFNVLDNRRTWQTCIVWGR